MRDPHILFGAIGDATCDRVPLQVGQFESDNRMDDDLGRMVLEGGGGGQMTESYELAMYFMARHTSIDCFEKRGRRGVPVHHRRRDAVPPGEAAPRSRRIIGEELTEDIPTEVDPGRAAAPVPRLLHPAGRSAHAGNRDVVDRWRDLLGQNMIELDDLDAVCETIALTVGLGEDAIGLDDGLDDLADVGSTAGASVGRALARIGSRPRSGRGGADAGRSGPPRRRADPAVSPR